MRTISFDGLAIVAAAALAAPLALGLFPRIRLPAIVLEIVLGIVIGPHALSWVSIDTPIRVMSLLGLAFLLLLSGLEVEYERFRGRLLRLTALGYAMLAERLGLEAILGAFLAGGIVKLVDRDQGMSHPQFRQKLEAVGYGVFVPVFFVATGVRFELNVLFANATNLARVPIFLTALLVVRGLPALVYKSLTTRTQTLAAALLQATSLSFLVVAGQIGVQLDLIRPAAYAALVAAGLLSVLLFPLAALTLLRPAEEEPRRAT